MSLAFTLNGQPCTTEAPDHWTVLDLLRDGLGLMGTKYGCGEGVCGTCTVLADGRPIRACLVLAAHVRGRALVTVEGLEVDGRLDPLQTAFAERGASQCGYCTPGIMAVTVSAGAGLRGRSTPARWSSTACSASADWPWRIPRLA